MKKLQKLLDLFEHSQTVLRGGSRHDKDGMSGSLCK